MKNNSLQQKLLDFYNDIIIQLDQNMIVTEYNQTAERILSISKEHILNKNLFNVCDSSKISLGFNKDDLIQHKEKCLASKNSHIFYNNKKLLSLTWKYLYDTKKSAAMERIYIIGTDMQSITITQTENAISKQSISQYTPHSLIANIPGIIYWKDREGRYLGCNNYFVELSGLSSEEEVIGKTDFDLIWKDQAENYRRHDRFVMSTGEKQTLEEELVKPSGERLLFSVVKAPLRDTKGRITGIIGTSVDISRHQEINSVNKLSNSDENTTLKQKSKEIKHINTIADIVDNIPGEIYWKDREGHYLGCNKHFLSLIGMSDKEEVIGKTDYDFAWKNEAEKLRKNDQLIMSTGKQQAFEEEVTLFNGKKAPFTSVKSPLTDDEGNIIGIIGNSINISPYKKLEKTLKNKQRSFQYTLESLIQSIPGVIYWKDTEGNYLGCNAYFLELAQLSSKDEVIGKTDFDLIWKDQAITYRKHDRHVISTGESQVLEEEATKPNGEQGFFSVIKAPLRNDKGEIIGIVGTSMDITYRQKARKTLEKTKRMAENASTAKSELIANMSHDLRTPLSGIMGLAHLTSESLNNTELCQQNLQDIERAAAQLINMANNILNTSSLEIGVDTVNLEPFSLQNTVDEIVTMLMPAIRDKGLSCRVELSPELPPALCSDNSIIFRMLLNLLSNALKFTDDGWIAIRAELISKNDQQSPQLQLVIADSGKGIPQKALETIFEAFKRLTPSYKSAYHGAGLGLYMVKKLLTSLNGEIKVDSELGKGSTFTLTFPVTIADESELPKEKPATMDSTFVSLAYSRNTRNPAKKKQKKRAVAKTTSVNKQVDTNKFFTLVVEDSEITQHVILAYLERFNCQIETAETLASAQQMAAEKRYDLILADIGLPDGNGSDLARQIRQNSASPNYKTPIVALTAHVTEDYKKRCLAAGMQYVLYKPLTPNKIEALFEALWQKDITAETIPSATEKPVIAKVTVSPDIIHFDSILAITANDHAKAKELLAMVIDSFSPEQQQMQDAYDQEDWQLLRKVVHKMHGAVGFYGLNKLKQDCRALDQELLTNTSNRSTTINKAEITPLYEQMIQSIEATQAAWQVLKQQKTPNEQHQEE